MDSYDQAKTIFLENFKHEMELKNLSVDNLVQELVENKTNICSTLAGSRCFSEKWLFNACIALRIDPARVFCLNTKNHTYNGVPDICECVPAA